MYLTRIPTQRYQKGDRVRIDKDITTLPALPTYIGTVKEVIVDYTDKTIGYNLSVEEDPRPRRVWFFLQDQLTLVERSQPASQDSM